MSVNVFIGFDFGTKKIGVAIAQTITNTATPMPAIKMINGQPKWNDLDEIISDFKPKKAIIGIPDSENKQTKKLTIVTPMGSLTSDSGSHLVDVITVLGVILAFVILKKLVSKYVK